MKCKPSKCEILRDSIKYLGRMLDRHGVRPDPEAVEAVLTWKAPRTDTQLLSFLGFANYYREFIKGYADKVYPMQKLMRNKGKKFEWNDEAQVAFENIKRELCEAPVLGMPTEKGMYVLDTDASVEAISEILHQEQEWNGRTVLRPIAYGSKVLSDTEMKYGASLDEMAKTYEALPLTRWLDKSGHPIPGHPELPVETAAEIKVLSKKDPVPLDLLLRSNLVQQELSRMNINSLSLLDITVQVKPQVMWMLGELLEREVTRDDPEWAAAMASLTVSEKVKIMPSRRQHKENERDCRTIVQQLVSSIPQDVLTSTSYKRKEQLNIHKRKPRRTVRRAGEFRVESRDKKACPGSLM